MIKKLLLFVGVLALFIQSSPVFGQDTQNFKINSFEADYYLSKDDKNYAQLRVVEKIEAEFPDFDQNHGIERAIPKKYRNNSLGLKIQRVDKADGSRWDYSTYGSNDNEILRIGNKDRYVRGKQTYVIEYTMRNVITFASEDGEAYGHDEWYWDVNGTEWSQPFGSVVARIHLADNIASTRKENVACFTGGFGVSKADCSVAETDIVIEVENTSPFESGENLSFAMAFERGTFTEDTSPQLVQEYRDRPAIIILAVVGILLGMAIPIATLIVVFMKWYKSGKDPKGRGVVVPQYSVPKKLNPILADVILNERLLTRAISATMIDLCVKGYLKLYEIEKDKLIGKKQEYEIELIKNPSDLSTEEAKVLTMLFSGDPAVGQRVNMNSLKNKLYKDVKTLSSEANTAVANQGYFVVSPEKARGKYVGIGTVLLIVGFIPLVFFPPALLATAGIGLSGLMLLIAGSIMPKRTILGVETKEYLLGVKDYMKLAEEDRIKLLQAPGTAEKINLKDNKQLVKLYEKLLPYAMLFGIEKDWAKQFAHLYGENQQPTWYSGHSAFNAVLFSSAIGSFNSVAVSSFSPPSSSGSSGSGGGGFSGGGGGGGGGGGW